MDESDDMSQDAWQAVRKDLAIAIQAAPFDGDAVLELIEVDASKLSQSLKLVRQLLVKKTLCDDPGGTYELG